MLIIQQTYKLNNTNLLFYQRKAKKDLGKMSCRLLKFKFCKGKLLSGFYSKTIPEPKLFRVQISAVCSSSKLTKFLLSKVMSNIPRNLADVHGYVLGHSDKYLRLEKFPRFS